MGKGHKGILLALLGGSKLIIFALPFFTEIEKIIYRYIGLHHAQRLCDLLQNGNTWNSSYNWSHHLFVTRVTFSKAQAPSLLHQILRQMREGMRGNTMYISHLLAAMVLEVI